MTHWILSDGQPVPALEIFAWARWFERTYETGERVVAQTEITPEVSVSTVFLGLDHRFSGNGPPILWETLVFGGPLDGEMKRYTSRAQAEAGHRDMVVRVRRGA